MREAGFFRVLGIDLHDTRDRVHDSLEVLHLDVHRDEHVGAGGLHVLCEHVEQIQHCSRDVRCSLIARKRWNQNSKQIIILSSNGPVC